MKALEKLRAGAGRAGLSGKNLVIVLALLAAGFFAGYLRFRPYLGREASYTDGERRYALTERDRLRYAVWDRAEALSQEINSPGWESRPTLSPDGRFLVFSVGRPGLNADLYVADVVAGEAVDPRPLRVLNTEFDELAPAFAPGWLYFASNRPESVGALDVYRAAYDDGSFAVAENLGVPVNTSAAETDPAPLADGSFAFASDRSRGARTDFELYLATPGPTGGAEGYDVRALGELNTPWNEREPAFTGDGLAVFFATDRAGGEGSFDLWRSVRDRGLWLPPEPLAGVNSPASERAPWPTADGFTLYFAAEDAPGDSDLFRARSLELFRVPGRPVGWLDLVVLGSLLVLALLAWLAKRWEKLDIIYKCYLVSLLVHLLALWLFKKVLVESEAPPTRERERTFKVRVAADLVELAAARERAGRLEDALPESGARSGPERLESSRLPEEASAAPGARSVELQRTEAAPPEAPGRAAAVLQQAAPAAPPAVATEAPREALQRLQGAAPALALASRSVEGAPARAVPGAPDREAPAQAREARPAPASRAAPRAEPVAPQAGPAFAAAPLDPSRQAGAEILWNAVATPVEAMARQRGGAPELALAAPAAEGPTRKPLDRPARAGSAVTERPDRVPSASLKRVEEGAVSLAASVPARVPAAGQWIAPAAEPAAAASEVAVAEPLEAGERMVGGVEPMALAAAASFAPPQRAAAAPGRAMQRPADVPVPAAPSRSPLGLAQPPSPAEAGVPVHLPAPAEPVARAALPVKIEEAPPSPAPPAVAEAERGDEPEAPLVAFGPRRAETEEPDRVAWAAAFFLEAEPSVAPARSAPAAAPADALQAAARAAVQLDVEPSQRAVSAAAVALNEPSRAPALEGASDAPAAAEELVARDVAAEPQFRALAHQDPAQPRRLEMLPEAPAPEPVSLAVPLLLAQEPAGPEAAPQPGRLEHTPYRGRVGPAKELALRQYGGGMETERAVASGLAYLARRQSRQGNWWSRTGNDEKYGSVTVGRTALCLLAFLGAGHTQSSGTEYSRNVQRAIEFLLSVQDPVSGHLGNSEAYSHGIATYALAECFAMTEDAKLRAPLERAVARILAAQNRTNDPRRAGGWSYYYPGDRIYDTWPRASITAWQVMALESARLGGLEVPGAAFEGARRFLLGAHDQERGAFRYSHDPMRLRSVYPLLPGSTPASLFALALLGEDPNAERFVEVRRFVLERAPRSYAFTGEEDFVSRAQGNDYFWYYGTLAMFRCGGEDWERWNQAMKKALLPAQQEDGSWKPISIYAEVAGDTDWDRSYSTAMCVLTLEIYYRYFTPLLRVS